VLQATRIEETTMVTSTSSPGKTLTALMQRSRKVLGVAVIEESRVAWSQVAAGPPDRLFQAGSISKPVTALVALELAARGQIDLDGDVNEQLASWHLPGSQSISLRQLLGHTSSIGIPFFPGYPQGTDVPTLCQVLDGAAPSATPPVRSDPLAYGTFRYSGGGYAVVQQLIEDVTGLPFAQAARSFVLEPLEMTHSTFEQPLPAGLRPAAARHDWHVYPESAAAGLWTTPGDLARYVCALQDALAGRASAVRGDTAAAILTPHTPLPAKGEWNILPILGMRPPDSCGLGMFLHGSDRFSHFGGAASFFSAITASMGDGSGAVVMTAANASPFPFKVLRLISDERSWTGFRQPARKRLHGLPGIRHLAWRASAGPRHDSALRQQQHLP
jgi:CubicO group peptidase (beta-lactamase class C family)